MFFVDSQLDFPALFAAVTLVNTGLPNLMVSQAQYWHFGLTTILIHGIRALQGSPMDRHLGNA